MQAREIEKKMSHFDRNPANWVFESNGYFRSSGIRLFNFQKELTRTRRPGNEEKQVCCREFSKNLFLYFPTSLPPSLFQERGGEAPGVIFSRLTKGDIKQKRLILLCYTTSLYTRSDKSVNIYKQV